jgi:hypothetical protein
MVEPEKIWLVYVAHAHQAVNLRVDILSIYVFHRRNQLMSKVKFSWI